MKQEIVANENMHTHLKDSNVRGGKMTASVVDISGLERDLRAAVSGEVRFDDGSRALYSTDASNYGQVPIGVVIPRNVEDVVEAIATCHHYGAPIFSRGGATSLAGQCCNVAVAIDMSKYMNSVIGIDPQKKLARVQPGNILDDLRHAAERYKLTFGPDPATHNHCTLGGMIGNDSCGTHSVMAGKTVDNIEELDILTYDGLRMRVGKTTDEELERIIREGGRRGEIYARLKALRDKYANLIRERYPKIPRRVSGYNLDQLLPENGFNVAGALVGTESTCVTVLEATARLVNSPQARVLLVLGYPDIYSATDHIMEILAHNPIALEGMDGLMIEDAKKKDLLPADISLLPSGGGWLLVEFGRDTMQEARNQANGLMEKLKQQSNAPHMQLFDKREDEEKIWLVRETALGATGRVPGEKDAWPGWEDSAVPPDKVSDYLRDLRDYHQVPVVMTHFKFPEDRGSFAQVITRCIGVGKCRRMSGGTMCPSFMVTREEADTTRGRARLLFEMLQGNPVEEGWHSDAVKDALDLCLACKGCKGDCPVNVDMATYKAEFLSHYYDGKPRPLSGYSMGLIYWWSRLAALAPGVANFFMQAPVLSSIVKTQGGISSHRTMPKFAPQTFKQWFQQREPKNMGKAQVLLWPDTFNNHFHPETAIAAVEVLEAAGYQVIVPKQSLCCGRPLYDFGFLDLAETLLRQILDTLRPQIRAGISVVGLEPGCVSVFRDELINLFPDDEDAQQLAKQSFLLSEFLVRKEKGEFVGRTYPEEEYIQSPRPPHSRTRTAALIGAGALLIGVGTLLWRLLREHNNASGLK